MKRRLSSVGGILLVGLAGLFATNLMNRASAQVDLSFNLNIQSPTDFYGPLAPYGVWVDVSPYGRCWRPTSVPPDWQPYTTGHWEWTDAGWYWVSEEPWSWACYHYGQWVLDPVYGWVWLPGTEWAPAWVTWREAPDYIGWAPCGPGGAVYGATPFLFVDVHRFHDRLRPREFLVGDRRIFDRSRRVGGFRTETRDWGGARRRIAINRGPDIAPIERATGARFVQRPVHEVVRQTPPPPTTGRSPGTFTQQPTTPDRQRASAPDSGVNPSRLYREPRTPQPTPTGRQEQRLYRDAPTQQPTVPPTARPEVSPQVPARRELPGRSQPVIRGPAPATPAQTVPRPLPAPTAAPAPMPTPTPVPAPRNSGGFRQEGRDAPLTRAPDVTPRERPLPPTGFERGRRTVEVPSRPQQAPGGVRPPTPVPPVPGTMPTPPAPSTPPGIAPAPEGNGHGRRRGPDGQ